MTSDQKPRLTLEHAAYAGLFALALVLRFQALGRAPLSDLEAHEALAALNLLGHAGEVARQTAGAPPVPFSPAYSSLGALTFLIFGHGNGAARAVPALAGSLLVVAPYLFRRELGKAAALGLGALLLLSPLFTAASRTADGAILSLASLALTLGGVMAYLRSRDLRSLIWVAVGFALSLASGPAMITGWLTLAAALLLARLLKVGPAVETSASDTPLSLPGNPPAIAAVAGGLTFLVVVTFGSLYPAGLASFANQLSHWVTPPVPRPAGLLPLTLALYEPLILIFGLIGAGRAILSGDGFRLRLAWWAIMVLLFSLLFPGRTAADALWALLPLAALAAGELAALFKLPETLDDRLAFLSQVVIILILLAFVALNLGSYAADVRISGEAAKNTRLLISLGALGMAALVTVMFAVGWSSKVALHGARMAVSAALVVYGLSAMWSLTRLHPGSPLELWNDSPTAPQLTLLENTLADISNRNVGDSDDIEVVVQANAVSALGWALRDFSKAKFVDDLGAEVTAPVVIAPDQVQNPTLGSTYIGQAFTVRERSDSPGYIPQDWAGWLVYRRGPLQAERVILWARADVQTPKIVSP